RLAYAAWHRYQSWRGLYGCHELRSGEKARSFAKLLENVQRWTVGARKRRHNASKLYRKRCQQTKERADALYRLLNDHQTGWQRLQVFFQLPGRIFWGRDRVEVELQRLNDRALHRDLEELCANVAKAQPLLPDGRRLLCLECKEPVFLVEMRRNGRWRE